VWKECLYQKGSGGWRGSGIDCREVQLRCKPPGPSHPHLQNEWPHGRVQGRAQTCGQGGAARPTKQR